MNNTSPVVTVNATYGISWGGGIGTKDCNMNVENGSVLTLNANVYGSGSLNKYGGGTAAINTPDHQASVGASGTNVFEGTLITDNPTNDYNVREGGTMNFNIRPLTWLGTRGDLTYAGNVYGPGNFVKSGSATLTMTQDVYYTGATTVEGGRLVIATFHNPYVTSGFQLFGGDLELQTNTSHQTYEGRINGTRSLIKSGLYDLTLTAGGNGVGAVELTGGRLIESFPISQRYTLGAGRSLIWNIPAGQNYTYGGAISGNGNFTKTGASTLIFNTSQSYTGGTTVSGGNLQDKQPHGDYAISAGCTVSAPIIADQTLGGSISGAGHFIKSGTGTLTLTADYSTRPADYWTGLLRVNGGRVVDQHPHGNYSIDAGDLEFAVSDIVYFGPRIIPRPMVSEAALPVPALSRKAEQECS